jgi:hypothetical protein
MKFRTSTAFAFAALLAAGASAQSAPDSIDAHL